jgi:predicted RNase H-like nuclease (RuvC/YqgF family)
MTRTSKQRNSLLHARQLRHHTPGSDNENKPPLYNQIPDPPSHKKKTLATQISEKDERITELEVTVTALESSLRRLQYKFDTLQEEHSTLSAKYEGQRIAHGSLKSLKRKADMAVLVE